MGVGVRPWNYWLMNREFLFAMMRIFWKCAEVRAVQHHECTDYSTMNVLSTAL